MLGFIGYGDAAQAIAKGLHDTVGIKEMAAWSVVLEDEGFTPRMTRAGSEKLKEVGELDIRNHLTHGRPTTWQEALRYLTERSAEVREGKEL